MLKSATFIVLSTIKDITISKHKTEMPLHTLSREVLRMILEHIPERKRVQVLLTCKDLAKLLAERRTTAHAAFDGLAAELANGDYNWSLQEDNTIFCKERHNSLRGTRDIDYGVRLQDSGVVRIEVTINFRDATCRNHGGWTNVHELYPWMKMICKYGQEAERIENDSEMGVVFGALVRS